MDQQQKFEERQEKLVMELHKQQLEFQLFTLQKTEQQQKQLEELHINSLNGSKNSEKDAIFSQSSIYNSIDTFEYVPENDKTFEAFYWRYEDIFNVDCEQWPSKKKIRLLLRKLGTAEHNRFVDFILHNDFKLAELTADDFKRLIFAQGLISAEDAEVRRRVLIKLENEQGLTFQNLAEDCQRVISVKCDSQTIEESGVAQIRKIRSKSTAYSPQKPSGPCYHCGKWHWMKFCPVKKKKYCHKNSHSLTQC